MSRPRLLSACARPLHAGRPQHRLQTELVFVVRSERRLTLSIPSQASGVAIKMRNHPMPCRRSFNVRRIRLVLVSALALSLIIASDLDAQTPSAPAQPGESAKNDARGDPLGRSTPRGAVIG